MRLNRGDNIEIKHEQQAMKNDPAPPELSGIDLLTYYALCYVYRLYNDKSIDRATGSQMKSDVLRAYQSATDKQSKYSTMWSRMEQTASTYAKEPNVDNADRFYAAVYNLPNDWRLQR